MPPCSSCVTSPAPIAWAEIKQAISALEKACGFYVERRMNQSIQQAMAGHSVNEFE